MITFLPNLSAEKTFCVKHPKRAWHVVGSLCCCCVLLPKNSIVQTKYIAMLTGAETFQRLVPNIFHLTNLYRIIQLYRRKKKKSKKSILSINIVQNG